MGAISENVKPRVIGLLLALICAAIYGKILAAGYVRWDDDIHVYANPYLNPVSPDHLRHFWAAPYEKLYVPVSYTLLSLLALTARMPAPLSFPDGLTVGLDPRVFHLASLLLHAANALLVFSLLRRLVQNDWAAAAGAALFAVHPVQVESVAWISEMRGLLSACFALLALRLHLGTERRRFDVLASLCFVLALLSKPSATTIPLIAWAIDGLLLQRDWKNGLKTVAAWGGLSLAALAVTHGAQPVNLESVTPFWTRPIIAGDALAFYLGKLVCPIHLGMDYGRTPLWVMAHWEAWADALVPVALAMMLWRLRRPWLTASALVFTAALLPTLGLTPFNFQIFSTVADRYLYLALLGPALALAWGLTSVTSARRSAWAACGAVLCVFAVLSVAQTRVWSNSVTLFTQAITVNPRSWVAHNNLGAVWMSLHRPADAEPEFEAAISIRPNYPEAHDNLGVALYNQGHPAAAAREFQAALTLRPDFPGAHADLGTALLVLGKPQAAVAELQEALRGQPDFPAAQQCLALALKAARLHPPPD